MNQRQLSVQRASDQHDQRVLQQHRHADHRPRDPRELAVVPRRKQGVDQESGAADVGRSGDDREEQGQVLKLGVGNQRESVSRDDVRVAENKRHRQRFERCGLLTSRTFAEPAAQVVQQGAVERSEDQAGGGEGTQCSRVFDDQAFVVIKDLRQEYVQRRNEERAQQANHARAERVGPKVTFL